MANTQPVGN